MASDGKRKYSSSSSFKMAVLFSVLLGISSSILIYFIYSYGQGEYIGKDLVAIHVRTYEMILLLGVLSISSMSLVVIISFLTSNFVVKRINIIGSTAQSIINTGNLSRRIDIDTTWDDLSNLSEILNTLFDRIETSMEDVRRVSDNIAHDLKTPLTRLRNNLETLKKKKSLEEEDIDKMIDEADQLLQTFGALLRITNIEKGKRHSEFRKVDLKEIINDVTELYEPIAEDKNVKIKSNLEEIKFEGDKDLLFQAIANILDNAVKFSKNNTEIIITLKRIKKEILIKISDGGNGISLDDKKRIFERFYRADQSRNSEGSGLGLSLVYAIIKLHKGSIEVTDSITGGSEFIIIF